MSEPAHYVTSDYYQPGLLSDVGYFAFAVVLILAAFIAAVVGSQIVLRRSRNLNPTLRKILRTFSGLAKPAAPLVFKRRGDRLGSREKTEVHYKMKAAARESGPVPVPAPARARPDEVIGGMAEPPTSRKWSSQDYAPSVEEAWPFYGEDEVLAAAEVLRSGKVNQWTGSRVFDFEQAYTRLLRNGRAIALTNGSVALELALRALRVGPGDEVIVTPRSFVASASCVRLVGATPVFVDVDRDSGNITAETIAAAITPRTKAVIPVHLAGWPADMPAIMALARKHGILVIEDCAQAHGAEIDGLPVGSFGDVATFSFCQDKILSTAGEGGLVSFRDDRAFEWAWSYKDHGKDRTRALERPAQPVFRWLHDQVGTNWRMTEIAAAIGLTQLDKLPGWHARRQRNAETWGEALRAVSGLRAPQPASNFRHGYYKFYAYLDVDPADNLRLRDAILAGAGAAGLRVFSGSCSEIYREAAFTDLAVAPLPIARSLGQSSLMVEVHPTLDPMRLRDRADALARIARSVIG